MLNYKTATLSSLLSLTIGKLCLFAIYIVTLSLSSFSVALADTSWSSWTGGEHEVSVNTTIDGTATLTKDGTLKVISNDITVTGGSKQIINAGTGYAVTINNNSNAITFTGGSATTGGAVYAKTISFDGTGTTTFSGNASTANGGAIYSANGFEISGGTNIFKSNKTTSSSAWESGGAIYSGGALTISGGINTFDSNSAASTVGGAILSNTGVVTISGGTNVFQSNNSTWGGAIQTENVASSGKYAIRITGDSTTTFKNNKAVKTGGALRTFGGVTGIELSADNGTDGYSIVFDSNSTTNYYDGGAMESGSIVDITGTGKYKFYNNSAKRNGGAILNTGTLTISNDSTTKTSTVYFEGNKANGTGTMKVNNVAHSLGGGAILGYGGAVNISGNVNTTFKGNTASNSGGAIRIFNNSMTISGGTNLFESNTAKGTTGGANDGGSGGGAIYADTGITITGNSTTTFKNNTASLYGGAIRSNGFITLSANNGTDGYSIVFESNAGKAGGAIMVYGSSGDVFITGDESGNGKYYFYKNTATGSNGGAIYALYSLSISGGDTLFKENSTNGAGGALHVEKNFTISGGTTTFDGNKDTGSTGGGGLFVKGTAVISGNSTTTFKNNTTNQYGGAIRSHGAFTLSANNGKTGENDYSVTFEGNTATSGGALITYGSAGDINITGDGSGEGKYYFHNNSATNYGGAIYAKFATNITGGTTVFEGNSAGQNGGAILATSTVTISGGTTRFEANSSDANGGAISVDKALSIGDESKTVSVTFENNTATGDGGAIYALDSVTFLGGEETNITFSGNKANGVNNDIYTTATSSGVSISGPGMYSFGGGIVTTMDTDTTAGKLQISGGVNVSFGAGSITSIANDFSLSASNLTIDLNSNTSFVAKSLTESGSTLTVVPATEINGVVDALASAPETVMTFTGEQTSTGFDGVVTVKFDRAIPNDTTDSNMTKGLVGTLAINDNKLVLGYKTVDADVVNTTNATTYGNTLKAGYDTKLNLSSQSIYINADTVNVGETLNLINNDSNESWLTLKSGNEDSKSISSSTSGPILQNGTGTTTNLTLKNVILQPDNDKEAIHADIVNLSGTGIVGSSTFGQLNITGIDSKITLDGDSNTISGTTTISEGTLKLTGDGTLGTGSVSISENGTLEYNVADSVTKNIANSISGLGTILKSGAGILVMAQDATVKQFNVDAGTLQMVGNTTLNGSMAINEDGKLELGIDTTPVSATITSNLTVEKGGKFNFNFSTDDNDLLNLGGNFTLNDKTVTLSFLSADSEKNWFDGLMGDGYQLIAMTGNTLTGDLSRYLDTTGLTQDWGLTGLPTGLYLTVAPAPGSGVPEPSTWALLVLGFAGLMKVARKRGRR